MTRPKLTYANVTATLALFVALGGTSYAVAQLPRNSVGTAQLKPDAVTSTKIRDGSVRRADLAATARATSPRGPRGASGPPGPQGAVGPAGPVGPSESIQVRRTTSVGIPAGAGGSVTLASAVLDPGSWLIHAQTRVLYSPSGGSEWFDCFLTTAAGTTLMLATVRVGDDSGGTRAGTIPVFAAATFAVPTEVLFRCSHPSAIGGSPSAGFTNFVATRTGTLQG